MRIGVGSGNPVKRHAVESVVTGETAPFDSEPQVESVSVESGVDEQPWGVTETVSGAETRAVNVFTEGYDLGIGIEGGVAESDAADGLFLIMWAAVVDGEVTGRAAGPQIRLPARVATRLRDGAELGPVMDDLLDESDVARGRGAAGELTGGQIDRETALATAVAGALAPFVSGLYGN
ncbi:MAG: hypothetical protein A07HR60_01645 [uncultured archaeon A07HR60]|jgi:Uncharacterized conserved protein|nr:MAG: hypothetical protein J07HR59_01757 [Halorubrum sp. J07HR59]ESS11588.1 MAG: hypothetical protein A07HR60_01645 [uncultured archaeon A07HR60]